MDMRLMSSSKPLYRESIEPVKTSKATLPPSRRRPIHSAILPVVGIGVALLLISARRNFAAHQSSAFASRFTAEQILARSEPIAQEFSQPGKPMRLTADPIRTAILPTWVVICTEPKGREILSLRWVAQTGELISAGAAPLAKSGRAKLTNAEEALQAGRTWMRKLRLDENAWHLERPVFNSLSKLWQVRGESNGRRLTLHLEGRTNRLTFATIAPSHHSLPNWGVNK